MTKSLKNYKDLRSISIVTCAPYERPHKLLDPNCKRAIQTQKNPKDRILRPLQLMRKPAISEKSIRLEQAANYTQPRPVVNGYFSYFEYFIEIISRSKKHGIWPLLLQQVTARESGENPRLA